MQFATQQPPQYSVSSGTTQHRTTKSRIRLNNQAPCHNAPCYTKLHHSVHHFTASQYSAPTCSTQHHQTIVFFDHQSRRNNRQQFLACERVTGLQLIRYILSGIYCPVYFVRYILFMLQLMIYLQFNLIVQLADIIIYKLYCSKSNLNVQSHFFLQRCITAWNSLPSDVITSPSLSIFNSKLYNVNFEKFLIMQIFIF